MSLSVNERLLSRTVAHHIGIQRVAAGAVQQVASRLRDSDAEIFDVIRRRSNDDGAIVPSAIDKLLGTVRNINSRVYRDIGRELAGQLTELARYEVEYNHDLFDTVLPFDWQFTRPRLKFIRSIVNEEPMHGGLLDEWVEGLAFGRFTRVRQAIRTGISSGETAAQVIKRIRGRRAVNYKDGVLDMSMRSAQKLVSTIYNHVANRAKLTLLNENSDVVQFVVWTAVLDDSTCDQCAALDGEQYSLEEAAVIEESAGGPPLHPNCLLGDCLVTARDGVVAVSKRTYDGEIVIIRTASGRELRCTPNHPVLTDGGFVAAHALNEGMNVISDGGSEWVVGRANENVDNVPARIEDFAETFARTSGRYAVPVTGADFHGDGRDGEVAVIFANRFLRNDNEAAIFKELSKSALRLRRIGDEFLSRLGSFALDRDAVLLTAPGNMRSSNLLFSFVGGHLSPFDEFLFRLGAKRDASSGENSVNRLSVGAIPFGQGEHTGPIDVGAHYLSFPDRIVEKSLSRVENVHVFNLQTNSGVFTAGGIITHNCRCTMVPVMGTLEDFDIDPEDVSPSARSMMDGRVPSKLSYQKWLEDQDKETQDDILGRERGVMFRRGLPVKKFVDHSGKRLTLPELRRVEEKTLHPRRWQARTSFMAVNAKRRNYGWKPDLPDQRDHLYAERVIKDVALPVRISLRGQMPPVFNQGSLGSCVANAIIAAMMFVHGPKTPMLSRLDLYYKARVIEDTIAEDSGAEIRDGIKALARWGVCTEATWPYKIRSFRQQPPKQATVEDDQYKITEYSRLRGHDDFLKCLTLGDPFVGGFSVYENFDTDTVKKTGILPLPTVDQNVISGHAVCFIGYDSDFHNSQVFKKSGLHTSQVPALMYEARNSFGPEWGDEGNFWIPASYVEDRDLADDFWMIRD